MTVGMLRSPMGLTITFKVEVINLVKIFVAMYALLSSWLSDFVIRVIILTDRHLKDESHIFFYFYDILISMIINH